MERRALLVGIDHYDFITPDLNWCTDDALAMRELLAYHANHGANYACHMLLGTQPPGGNAPERVTFNRLRAELEELFRFDGEVAFYFSGHGIPHHNGIFLAAQDGTPALPGILMNDLLRMANQSPAREVLLLLDCCYAGALGEPNATDDTAAANLYLREGVTLVAAAQAREPAVERERHGIFTRLMLGALDGGAADLRGRVSAASLYAYVEQALGPWDQRPIYKSNANRLVPIRYCPPALDDDELRRLPHHFVQPNEQVRLAPSYEVTHQEATPRHIAAFNLFKRYQLAGLLRPSLDRDLYFAAIRSHTVELTPLGRFYWQLAHDGLLGNTLSPFASRRQAMPNAESVAKLFHDTYEKLAPTFGYDTRAETRVPWDEVPERNKRLMIAVTAEVLAALFTDAEPAEGGQATGQATANDD